MQPTHFQSKKEGPWWNWTSGHVHGEDLKNPKKELFGDGVYINGCLVVALKDAISDTIWYPPQKKR